MSTPEHKHWPTMARETGLSLALLAVYVLTLLLPLHQAAALQRDFNAVGFSTLDSWSVCQPLAQDEEGEPRQAAALDCPATGIAKHQFAAVLPPAITLALPTVDDVTGLALISSTVRPILPDHFGQSRAPPVTV